MFLKRMEFARDEFDQSFINHTRKNMLLGKVLFLPNMPTPIGVLLLFQQELIRPVNG